MRATTVALVLAGSLLALSLAARPLADENLLYALPESYRVGFETREGDMHMTEMVPAGETVEAWTELLTTQVFFGLQGATPEAFRARLERSWAEACPGAQSFPVASGAENGYAFAVWYQACPLNPATGKPEKVWFKAIAGNDSFYLVQKAFRFHPSDAQIARWMGFLRSVRVCDTRLADRRC